MEEMGSRVEGTRAVGRSEWTSVQQRLLEGLLEFGGFERFVSAGADG